MGRLVVQPRRGDLDAGVDLVVEAEVFVDIRRGDLAGRDGADDGRRAGDAVAAGEDAVHIVDLAAGLGDERAALDGDLRLLKAVGLHALTDGDNDNVRRDALFAALGLFGRGAALFIHLADDLRLCPQRDGVTVRIGLDADRGLQRHELHALGNGALHFLGKGRHVLLAAAVDAAHFARAETNRAAADIHRDVAAADDDDVLVAEVRHVIVADLAQHLDRGDDALSVLALDAGLFIRVRAERDVKRVVLLAQLVERHIVADIDVDMHIDAKRQHRRDLRVEHFARQAVVGDAVAQHAAELRALFIHGDLVAHQS